MRQRGPARPAGRAAAGLRDLPRAQSAWRWRYVRRRPGRRGPSAVTTGRSPRSWRAAAAVPGSRSGPTSRQGGRSTPLQPPSHGVPLPGIKAAPDAEGLISCDRIGQAFAAYGTCHADVPSFRGGVVAGREEHLGIDTRAQRPGSPPAGRIRPGVLQQLRREQPSSIRQGRVVRHGKLPCLGAGEQRPEDQRKLILCERFKLKLIQPVNGPDRARVYPRLSMKLTRGDLRSGPRIFRGQAFDSPGVFDHVLDRPERPV